MAALMPLIAPEVRAAKRLVVKIGSALLVDRKAGLRQGRRAGPAGQQRPGAPAGRARAKFSASCAARSGLRNTP